MQSSEGEGGLMSLADAADQQAQTTAKPTVGPDGLFQCGYCKRNYNRADHLIRHVRSHTQEKPYVCPICAKGFARPDLVKRHAAGHDVEPDGKRRKAQGIPVHSARVSQACKACAASKLKCADEKPCRRCRQKNITCEFMRAAPPDSTELDMTGDESTMQNDYMYSDGNHANDATDYSQFSTPDEPTHNQQNPQFTGAVLEHDGNLFPKVLHNVVEPPNFEFHPVEYPPGYLNQGFTPRDFMDYSTEATLELDDQDFACLDAFNKQNTINIVQQNVAPAQIFGNGNGLPPPWEIDKTAGRSFFDRRVLSERLAQSSRDKVLGMVLDNYKAPNVASIVASFPSAKILDYLIQRFFAWQGSQIENWIHQHAFRTNAQRPELLGMIAAIGTTHTSVPTLRKLGFVLQEAARLAISRQFEAGDMNSTDLPLLQGYLLQLKMGLWSGNKRKMKLAESSAQPLVTVVRRARRFRRSAYPPPICPLPDDSGETLETKWRAWVARESYKRFVFHLFIHDAQVSMSMNVNPVISYTELSLPMPASQDLWHATDASHWKQMYFLKDPAGPNRLPSFIEVLQDMSQLSVHQALLDSQLSGLVVLCGLWGLIWEHRQLTALAKNQSVHWNSVILSSRHQELSQAMRHFRMSSSEWSVPLSPEVRLVQELVSMHLHMSFEELELYAEKEENAEARKVYYSAKQWTEGQGSRQAVGHAGQILRAAKGFGCGTLRDFYAIAVYHASLAFWSYGIVTRAQGLEVSAPRQSLIAREVPSIWLDDSDTAEFQSFVTLNRGKPGLKGSDRPVALDDPAAMMGVMRDVLNFWWGDDALPPLVENLSQLMWELGNAARVSIDDRWNRG